jgi:hypothetical protein
MRELGEGAHPSNQWVGFRLSPLLLSKDPMKAMSAHGLRIASLLPLCSLDMNGSCIYVTETQRQLTETTGRPKRQTGASSQAEENGFKSR